MQPSRLFSFSHLLKRQIQDLRKGDSSIEPRLMSKLVCLFHMAWMLPKNGNGQELVCYLQWPDKLLDKVNPYLPSGPIHPYQLDKPISNFKGCLVFFYIFIEFGIETV